MSHVDFKKYKSSVTDIPMSHVAPKILPFMSIFKKSLMSFHYFLNPVGSLYVAL